jgi:diguanylate cyclase (GGDEF)-like protein
MVCNLRWMILIGAALLLEDRATAAAFVVGASVVFAYNLLGTLACSSPASYARTRPWLGHTLRMCDIVVITLAVPVFSNDWGNFRLFYVPVVMGAGVVEGATTGFVTAGVAMVASTAIARATIVPVGGWIRYDLLANLVLFAIAALFGAYLGREGERDERNRLNVRRLAVFHDMGAALSNPTNIDHVAHLLCSVAVELTAIPRCVVSISNPETGRLEVRAIRGYRSEDLGPGGLPKELERDRGTASTHDIPLVAQSKVLGSLRLIPDRANERTPDDELNFLATLATQAATAIRNASLAVEIQRRAETDLLTGLANRWALGASAKVEIQRAVRYGHRLSVCLCDLDNFKAVNDTHGHMMGDKLLENVGAALKKTIRPGDIAARFGGDEFVVMLINADPRKADAAARRFKSVIAEASRATLGEHQEVQADVSIGVASFPEDGSDFEGLVRCADDRLLEAKRLGKGRIVGETVPEAA